jgi:organic radical activating enzyme
MTISADISEYFLSFQGEGLFVGKKQFFIRFSGCNISSCNYCDTLGKNTPCSLTVAELIEIVLKECSHHPFEDISLTGGEPLLWSDFIRSFLTELKKKKKFIIHLETNATLVEGLNQVASLIDRVSADFKLSSVTGQGSFEDQHVLFFQSLEKSKTHYFIKSVINETVDLEEFSLMCQTIATHAKGKTLCLQPEMEGDLSCISFVKLMELYDISSGKNIETRIIPQIHKFLKFK